MNNKKSIGKAFLVTLLFWALLIFGPFLLVIWNELSLVRYDQGTLGYQFFATITQAISALIAWYAASHVFDGAYCRASGVNCIVGATVMVLLLVLNAGSIQVIVSYGLTVVALIAGAVTCFREHDSKAKEGS